MRTRIGVIADIHGNAFTLRQILADLEGEQVDTIICLGDVAVLGPDPSGVVRELRGREIVTVLGNTDAWLLGTHSVPVEPPESEIAIALTAWTREQLAPEERSWLANLPVAWSTSITGVQVHAFHATPDSVDADVRDHQFGEQHRPTLAICAHTHNQCLRPLGRGWLLNPGSAGLPGVGPGFAGLVQHEGATWVEYAIVDVASANDMAIHLKRRPVDVPQMILWARAFPMPEMDWWIGRWGATADAGRLV